VTEKKPVVSVDLVILKSGKILLGKVTGKWSENGKYEWGLPGRELEYGESFEQAARKNLKEETGMELKDYKVFCVNNNFGFGNHYVAIGILAEAKGEPKLKRKQDWKEWKWFGKNEIPGKLFPSAGLTLKCFLEGKASAG